MKDTGGLAMKRSQKLLFVLLAILAVIIVGCKSGPEEQPMEEPEPMPEEVVELPMEKDGTPYVYTFKPTGVEKYDGYLTRARELMWDLDRAADDTKRLIPEAEKAAMEILGVLGDDTDITMIGDYKAKANVVIKALKMAGIKVSIVNIKINLDAGMDVDPDLMENIDGIVSHINMILDSVITVPDRMKEARGLPDELIAEGKGLIESASADLDEANVGETIDVLKMAVDALAGVNDKANMVYAQAKKIKDYVKKYSR